MGKKAKIPTRFERIIIDAIKKSKLTYLQLQELSGVNNGIISRFMSEEPNTRRTISLPVADRLCKALKLDLVYMKDKDHE
jgi:transcriptional regulator with XRE-family HTH domain